MSAVVIVPPGQLIDLNTVEQHLRVEHDDDDLLISAYLDAAQGLLDGPAGELQRAIGVQTLELRMDGFLTPIWGWAYDSGSLFWSSGPALDSYGAGGLLVELLCPVRL